MEVIILDSSVLNELQNCEMKLNYTQVRHLEPISRPDYFDSGDLFHDMLRLYLKLGMHRPTWPTDKKVDLAIKLANKRFPKMQFAIEDLDVIVEHFKAYTEHYNDRCVTLAVESTFIKELYRNDDVVVMYQGRVDWVTTDWPQMPDEIVVIDHKTGKRARDPFGFVNQFVGYCWALDTLRLIVNKIYFYKKIEPDKSFKRYLKTYHPDQIAEWVDDTIQWAFIYRNLLKLNKFGHNRTSCDKYSGCMFQNVCSAVPQENETLDNAREFLLARDFKKRDKIWDVGKEMEEI